MARCRYAGEPAGSERAPAQPPLHSSSQPQPATAQGNGSGPAMPRPAQTDAASSGNPSPAQPPVDSESQPQPGLDQGNRPGAPPLPGAGTAGSQASASFVAGAHASDVQVSSAASPALGTASGPGGVIPNQMGFCWCRSAGEGVWNICAERHHLGPHLEPLSQGSGDTHLMTCQLPGDLLGRTTILCYGWSNPTVTT